MEVDDLGRFNVPTLPSGTMDGIHYFHLTPYSEPDEQREYREARQRRIEAIRLSLRRRTVSNGNFDAHVPSGSPYIEPGLEVDHPRALFVRPSEIVYVMGAE